VYVSFSHIPLHCHLFHNHQLQQEAYCCVCVFILSTGVCPFCAVAKAVALSTFISRWVVHCCLWFILSHFLSLYCTVRVCGKHQSPYSLLSLFACKIMILFASSLFVCSYTKCVFIMVVVWVDVMSHIPDPFTVYCFLHSCSILCHR